MAKEYFKVKNQRLEFDTEAHTMTVTMHDDKFTVVSVQKMTENEFNGQYFLFKSQIFKALSTQQSGIQLTSEDALRLEHAPTATDFDDFVEMKDVALNYLNSIQFTSGSAQ
jgi:hypothetical protein